MRTPAPDLTPPDTGTPAHLGWRLLAALYDALPRLALWLATSSVVLALRGNQPLAPFSAGQWLLWSLCWAVGGLYFVGSWRRGGQTLGMRPWRLRVTRADGRPPGWRALALRYVVATVALALFGLGFFWALFEARRRTWHDLASDTIVLRQRIIGRRK
jgi:uncharacterized RDD family membrane protein YckC